MPDTCGLERFTAENYDAIQFGMSLDQVIQVMGCKFDPRATLYAGDSVTYAWTNFEVTQMFIAVTFDEQSLTITTSPPYTFKFWQGRSFVDQ